MLGAKGEVQVRRDPEETPAQEGQSTATRTPSRRTTPLRPEGDDAVPKRGPSKKEESCTPLAKRRQREFLRRRTGPRAPRPDLREEARRRALTESYSTVESFLSCLGSTEVVPLLVDRRARGFWLSVLLRPVFPKCAWSGGRTGTLSAYLYQDRMCPLHVECRQPSCQVGSLG